MAESEFDKTVKLPASGSQTGHETSKASTPGPLVSSPSADKTVKLTPDMDKTVKLSPVHSVPSASPLPTLQPSTPQSHTPIPPLPALPPLPSEQKTSASAPVALKPKKSGAVQIIVLSISILLVICVAAWYFLPPWFQAKAEKLAQEGKHSESAKQLRSALYFYPLRSDSISVFLGQELRLSKDLSNAQKILEKIVQKNPNDFDATRALGETLRDMGESQKALEYFQRGLGLKPEDTDVLRQSAQLAFELKNVAVAVSSYEKLTQSGAAEAMDWYQCGVSQFESGELEKAINSLQMAWKKNDKLKGVQLLLAKIYVAQANFMEAVNRYKLELSLTPEDPVLSETLAGTCLQAGTLFISKKEFGAALQVLKEGLTVSSKHSALLHYQLAILFSQQRRKKDSMDHLGSAIQNDASLKAMAKKEPAFAQLRKSTEFRKLVK